MSRADWWNVFIYETANASICIIAFFLIMFKEAECDEQYCLEK